MGGCFRNLRFGTTHWQSGSGGTTPDKKSFGENFTPEHPRGHLHLRFINVMSGVVSSGNGPGGSSKDDSHLASAAASSLSAASSPAASPGLTGAAGAVPSSASGAVEAQSNSSGAALIAAPTSSSAESAATDSAPPRAASAAADASVSVADAARSALLLEFNEIAIPGAEADQRLFFSGGKFADIVRFVILFNVFSTLRVRAKSLIIKACGLVGESLEHLREYLSSPVAERMAAAFDASRLGKLLSERKNRPAIWFPMVRMGSIEGVIRLLSGASSQVVSDRIATAYQLSEYIENQARRGGARDLYSNATKMYAASKVAGIPVVNIVAQRANKGRQGIMALEGERNVTRITKMVGGGTALTASTPVLSLSFLKVCIEKKMQTPFILTDLISVKTGMAGIVASTRPGFITDGLIELAVREVAAGRLSHPLSTETSGSDLCAQADIDLLRNGADHFRAVEPKTGLLPAPRLQRAEGLAPTEADGVRQERARPSGGRSWASVVAHTSKDTALQQQSSASDAAARTSAGAIAQTAQSVTAPEVLIQNYVATAVAISRHPAKPILSCESDGTWRLTIKSKDIFSAFVSAEAMKATLAEVGLKAIRATMIEDERAEIIFSDSSSSAPIESPAWRSGGNVRGWEGGGKAAEGSSQAVSSAEAPVVAAAAAGQPGSAPAGGRQAATPPGVDVQPKASPSAAPAAGLAVAAPAPGPLVSAGGASAAPSVAKEAVGGSEGAGASLPSAISKLVTSNPRSGVSKGIMAALARPSLVNGILAKAPDSVRVALIQARIIGRSKGGFVELPRHLVDQRTTDVKVLHHACLLREREKPSKPQTAERVDNLDGSSVVIPMRFSDATLRDVCESLFLLHEQDILRLHIGREQWETGGAARDIIREFDAVVALDSSAGASSAAAALGGGGVAFSSSSSSSSSSSASVGSTSGIASVIPITPAAPRAAAVVASGGGGVVISTPINSSDMWGDVPEQGHSPAIPTAPPKAAPAAVSTGVSAGVEESKEEHLLTPSSAAAAAKGAAAPSSAAEPSANTEGEARPVLSFNTKTPAKSEGLSADPDADGNVDPVVLSPPPGEKSLALLDRFVPAFPFVMDQSVTEGGMACAILASLFSRPSLHRVLEETASMGDDYLEGKFNAHFVQVRLVDSSGSSRDVRTTAVMALVSAFGVGDPKLRVESDSIGICAARQFSALDHLLPQGHGLVPDNSLSIFLPGTRNATKVPLSRCMVNVDAKANFGHIFEHLAKEIGLRQRGWRLGALPPYFTVFFAAPTNRLVFPEDLITTVFEMRKYCSLAVQGPAPVEGTGDESYRIVSVIYISRSGGSVCSCIYDPRLSAKQCYIIRDRIGEGRLVDTSEACDELEKVKVVSVSFASARL